MQDVGRYLLFSGAQADGLPAQLHALRLGVAARAEATRDASNGQLWQGLIAEHSKLLAKANLSDQATDARTARRVAIGAANGPLLQAAGLEPVSSSACFAGLLDQGDKAKQQLAQVTALLQSKLAAQQAALAGRDQQRARGAAAAQQDQMDVGGGAGNRRREISVPCKERKRDAAGSFRQQQAGPDASTAAAAAASARWGSGSVFAPASKRMAAGGNGSSNGGLPPVGPGRGAGSAYGHPQQQGPDEIEDSDGDDEGFAAGAHGGSSNGNSSSRPGATPFQQIMRQGHVQQGAAAADAGAAGGGGDDGSCVGGAGRPGFMSARAQLVTDLRKKGQHQQANRLNQQAAPRTGLTRPRGSGRQAGGAAAGGAGRGGFVPPFVGKAIDHATGGGGGGGGAAGANGAGGEEGPLSARTLEMLGVPPDGELPPELAKHDPKLIEQVCNEVIDASGGVAWEDIAGLETAKHLIKEIVVWPMLNPQIFTGPRAPPKGILLFGPPGTGKTLIGKAVASNIRASFFSISASSLTSKWIGEGEKMVKTLFAVAGVMQPSVIFIDEIDSILSARKSEGEHEASRRLKTEMLVQMEGCDPTSSSRRVLLVGATNRPEELDEAARRRMPKQLYIPLPCGEARRQLILRQLGPGAKVAADLSPSDLDKVVAKTEGYSGSDMRNLIQEACQGPIRDAVAQVGEAVATLSDADLRPVRVKDFQHAAKAQRASVTSAEIERYEAYNDRHGAKYVLQQQEGHAGDGPESDDDDW
ncbi:hypothetical protein OEZ85_005982 [Tetradesmus obliquus]|uniref:AAA+ ATPase domain-containing protein n=1 Tax=Tetradesmus obliquus TaxID=3088 RepID=A0ABY8UII9_TETOB|nr:hypothetical protein OEZ85_005982 [Tetradesmus obliquus]